MSRVAINLYQHVTQREGDALLLSRNGRRSDARHIPVSLLTVIGDSAIATSETLHGKFEVEEWKLRELGWLGTQDDRQGRLI